MRTSLACLALGFVAVYAATNVSDTYDYARNQVVTFAEENCNPGLLTTRAGMPVKYNHAVSTLNTNIFENQYLLDVASHMDRERVPERGVNARGIGSFGYFEVTNDVTKYTRANFLAEVGKKTEVALRFSQSFRDKGTPETIRDVRGMGIKMYTEEGNLNFACLNTPTYPIADPINAISYIHAQKRSPVTNIVDYNAIWDHVLHLPEQLNSLIYTLSDSGMPDGYRNMDAFAIHTYELENSDGDLYYARFNFMNNQGSNFLLRNVSTALILNDTEYFTRDLYNAIARGEYPSWTLYIQIMTYEQTQAAEFDAFSVNKYWPKDLYPYIEVGKLVVNRNPTNWFADVEQAAYSPGHLVPGINGGVDSTFLARSFVYNDMQYHRIGANYLELPINRPKSPVNTYTRDGFSEAVSPGAGPNYYPNSFNGPEPYVFANENNNSLIGRYIPKQRVDNDLFGLTTLYYESLADDSRLRLAENIAIVANLTTVPEILEGVVGLFYQISSELGENVRGVLDGTITLS